MDTQTAERIIKTIIIIITTTATIFILLILLLLIINKTLNYIRGTN